MICVRVARLFIIDSVGDARRSPSWAFLSGVRARHGREWLATSLATEDNVIHDTVQSSFVDVLVHRGPRVDVNASCRSLFGGAQIICIELVAPFRLHAVRQRARRGQREAVAGSLSAEPGATVGRLISCTTAVLGFDNRKFDVGNLLPVGYDLKIYWPSVDLHIVVSIASMEANCADCDEYKHLGPEVDETRPVSPLLQKVEHSCLIIY